MEFKRLILFFGRSLNDSDNSEFIDNIKKASKNLNIQFDILDNINNLTYTLDDKTINIECNNKNIKIELSEYNSTIVWVKYPSLNEKVSYIYNLIYLLSFNHFNIINLPKFSQIASDKLKTKELFDNEDIPQPKSISITYKDSEDKKTFLSIVKKIYGNTDDKNEYVIKLLNGHGGIGICIIDGYRLYSVVQFLFAILKSKYKDTDKIHESIIIQEKIKNADGDIRIHVLNIKGEQIILGAIKRYSSKSDFRSNVSLGNKTSKIKLTKEQEKLAIKVAKISGLSLLGIDIISDNKGNNYVLEINSSAGTGSISEATGSNFIENIFSNIKKIITQSDEQKKWLECVEKMYQWYVNNFKNKYDYNHGLTDNLKYCELINKEVKGDCSGFVGACLCLANYSDDPIHWNVGAGSYNLDGHQNSNWKTDYIKKIGPIQFMKNIDKWNCKKFNILNLRAGDIIYSNSHVSIVADDNAEYLYDWGRNIENNEEFLSKFYCPSNKYKGYWRINNDY